MKRLTLLFSTFFLLLGASVVHGQSNIKTGVKGGLNFASFSGADGTFDTRTGFTLGGFAKFSLPGTPFAIQPEALYSQKGAVQNGDEIRIDYIEIPIFVKYALLPGGVAQPNIFAGPYAGIRLLAESEAGTGGLFGGASNIESQTESIDYGGTAGIGMDIEVGSSIFTIDARYSHGFREVFKEESGQNSVFAVTVGLSLPSGM